MTITIRQLQICCYIPQTTNLIFDWSMVSNYLARKNDFYGITKDMFAKELSSLSVTENERVF